MYKAVGEVEEDFRTKLLFRNRLIDDNGCWIWIGSKTDGGYGYCTVQYRRKIVHRLAYEIFKGPIIGQVDHTCFIRLCFNPDHLEDVTQQENLKRSRVRKFGGE